MSIYLEQTDDEDESLSHSGKRKGGRTMEGQQKERMNEQNDERTREQKNKRRKELKYTK